MRKNKKLILALSLVLMFTLVFTACTKSANEAPDPNAGTPDTGKTPDEGETYEVLGTDFGEFTTTDLNGNEVTNEIFKDKKVTIIFLWSTG